MKQRPERDAIDRTYHIWVDGSFSNRSKASAWGAYVDGPFGIITKSGWIGRLPGPAAVEIEAVLRCLDHMPVDADLVIHTDCRALDDRWRGGRGSMPDSELSRLEEAIELRIGGTKIKWRRRCSSDMQVLSHHLANAARLMGELGGYIPQSVGCD